MHVVCGDVLKFVWKVNGTWYRKYNEQIPALRHTTPQSIKACFHFALYVTFRKYVYLYSKYTAHLLKYTIVANYPYISISRNINFITWLIDLTATKCSCRIKDAWWGRNLEHIVAKQQYQVSIWEAEAIKVIHEQCKNVVNNAVLDSALFTLKCHSWVTFLSHAWVTLQHVHRSVRALPSGV